MSPKGTARFTGRERRSKPRIYDRIPAQIWTVDSDGEKFETETLLENLSADGLCVRLSRAVEVGQEVLAFIRFTAEHQPAGSWPRIAACGSVVRSTATPEGTWETAVVFDRHMVL